MNKQKYWVLALCLFLPSCVLTIERNPYVDHAIWETVSPHFLPNGHPMKKNMDKIFWSSKRVVKNQLTLKLAGFFNTEPRKYSKTIVAYHKKLPGHLVKIYTDEQPGIMDWAKFVDRVHGAAAARACIEKHALQRFFVVPEKWIYPLPPSAPSTTGPYRKNFVLLVEEINLVSESKNLKKWKSSKISKELLNAVYILLKEAGLSDSVYAFNLPFSSKGKIAIIDTEYANIKHVKFMKLTQYLSKENSIYWKRLVEQGGPAL